jgi:hypothetical protein
MGLPAELLDAFSRLSPDEADLAEDPFAALQRAEAEFWSAAEKASSSLDSLSRSTDAVEAQISRFEAAIREEIAGGSHPDLSFAVEFMEQQEQHVKRKYLPRLQIAKRLQSEVFKLPPSARPRAMSLHRKQVATYTRILQSTADMKLRMVALRAMAEPPGDAPVFSDADELERYLDAL